MLPTASEGRGLPARSPRTQSVLRKLTQPVKHADSGSRGSSGTLLQQQASGGDLVQLLRALAAWQQHEVCVVASTWDASTKPVNSSIHGCSSLDMGTPTHAYERCRSWQTACMQGDCGVA